VAVEALVVVPVEQLGDRKVDVRVDLLAHVALDGEVDGAANQERLGGALGGVEDVALPPGLGAVGELVGHRGADVVHAREALQVEPLGDGGAQER